MKYEPEQKKPIFWWDMDGTLTVYDYAMYSSNDPSVTPPFYQRQSHCFLDLEPHSSVLQAYNILYARSKVRKTFYNRVLTSIPVGILQAEHTIDKYFWCENHIRQFDVDDFFCISVPKHSGVASDLWQLTEKDILIDDYNRNLINWKEHGGTAIKCVNNINSVNPLFDYIRTDWSANDIVRVLSNYIK